MTTVPGALGTVCLRLPQESMVLAVSVTPPDPGIQSTIDANTVSVVIPYLNAVGDHKQILKLSVLVDGETEPLSASGGGEDWSVRFVPLVNPLSERYRFTVFSFVCGFVVGAIYVYGRFIERRYGIPMIEVSWRALFYDLPPLAVLLALFFILDRLGRIRPRRLRRSTL